MTAPVTTSRFSVATSNEATDLFTLPPTDISSVRRKYVSLEPLSTSITPVEFVVPPMVEYVDLSRSYFTVDFTLMKDNNTKADKDIQCGPLPNLFHTIIRQPSVYLNNTLITEQTDTYPWKAYLETILNYSSDASKTFLATQGWYNALDGFADFTGANLWDAKDKSTGGGSGYGHADHITALKKGVTTAGSEKDKALGDLLRLRNQCLNGTRLVGRPHIDIFQQDRLLVTGVEIKIRFDLNPREFWLIGNNTTGVEMVPEGFKMKLHLCQVDLHPTLFQTVKRRRLTQNVLYPTVRSEIRTYHMANENLFDEFDIFRGRIPDRVVMVLITPNQFNGNINTNPFSFKKKGLIDLKQYVNGEEQPYESLELTGHNQLDRDMEAYHRLMQASCIQPRNKDGLIQPHHWGHLGIDLDTGTAANVGQPSDGETTLFMFDNIASGCADDANTLNPRKRGNYRLRFRLQNSTVLKVLIYGEFENTLQINRDGMIIYPIYKE